MSRRTEHFEDGPFGRDVAGNGRDSTDYRELVIEALAGDEAAQLDRIVDLSAERDQYQECFKVALHALAAITEERNRYRRQYRALLNAQAGGVR